MDARTHLVADDRIGLRHAARDENFPVASRLLPSRHRDDLLAVYGAARLIDDAGDRHLPGEAAADRLRRLDAVADQVRLAAATGRTGEAPDHPVFARLARTMADRCIDEGPFLELIEANRWDQRRTRYPTYDELRAYCRLSAEPVGRIVLTVFDVDGGDRQHALVERSDDICAALQLVEHWQDVSEDAAMGRVYVPEEDLERFGVAVDDLTRSPAGPSLRALIAFEVHRTRQLLASGASLIDDVHGWARWAVAGFIAGGHAALDSIVDARFDVTAGRPPRSRLRFARRFAEILTRMSGP